MNSSYLEARSNNSEVIVGITHYLLLICCFSFSF